jgi:hypothetical protein
MSYPAQPYGAPPQQQYPPQPPPQQYVQPGQAPQQYPPTYAPPPYPQQYGQQPPQQPQQAPAQGSIDDYYSQPSGSFGGAISWKDKPLGTTYAGIVARTVTNADIIHDSDPQTQQLKFYRDMRPKFVMKVPMLTQPSQEFPDGEMTWFVRGQARDELTRAMQEAGVQGAPEKGAYLSITLVERKPQRQGNPANIVQVTYQPPQDQGSQGAVNPNPQATIAASGGQPVEQPPVAAPPQQFQQQAATAPPQYAQAPQQPVQVPGATASYQAPPQQQQAPQAQAPQGAPQPPSDLNPDQQALLAKLTQQQG